MKNLKNRLAIIAVLAAGSLWGMMGIFVRRYNSLGLQTVDIVTIRAVGTALVLCTSLLCTKASGGCAQGHKEGAAFGGCPWHASRRPLDGLLLDLLFSLAKNHAVLRLCAILYL